MRPDQFIIVNLSGRGDKDVDEVTRLLDIRKDVAVAPGGCPL
jgi:tryptophan synthase beta chain